jgi:hypothetical protein
MPDVFEVLGAAHRDVEQMLDRMRALIGAPRNCGIRAAGWPTSAGATSA